MRKKLALKILLRSPARTLLSVALLGVVTFALFSQVAEYAITSREVNSARAQYYGLGSIEVKSPIVIPGLGTLNGWPRDMKLEGTASGYYKPLMQEQIDAVLALPQVSSSDTRFMTAGLSESFYRLDDGDYFFDFTARAIVEATVVEEREPYRAAFGDIFRSFYVTDVKMLAGHVPQISEADTIQTGDEHTSQLFFGWQNITVVSPFSQTGMTENRASGFYYAGHDYGDEYLKDLIVGGRYVFVMRVEPIPPQVFGNRWWSEQWWGDHLGTADDYYYNVGDPFSGIWCNAIWPLDGLPDNYLELDEYRPLRNLIEITNADNRTFDMVYTEDMGSIMRFSDGRMEITEGRMLTPEDSQSDAAICAVSAEFAQVYGLGIGDTITMSLGTKLFEQFGSLGAVAGTPIRYARPASEVTLEVVGIYRNTDTAIARSRDAFWSYSINTIFLPRSLLPAGAGEVQDPRLTLGETGFRIDEVWLESRNDLLEYLSMPTVSESDFTRTGFTPSEFSFRIDDVRNIRPFLAVAEPMLFDMGLGLILYDGGWRFVEQGYMEVARLSAVRIALFTAAVAAATCLAVYLFIGRRKNDYAIMRALGTTRRKAGVSLALPLMVVTAVSVLLGGTAACLLTLRTIESSNALVALDQYAVNTSIPMPVVFGCALGQLLLTLGITLAMLIRIGRTPPLALLHGDGASPKRFGVITGLLKSKSPRMSGYSHSGTAKESGGSTAPGAMLTGGMAASGAMLAGGDSPGTAFTTGGIYTGSSRKSQVWYAPSYVPRPEHHEKLTAQLRFIVRYIRKHIKRSTVKSAMAALLAALLCFAIGWISELKTSYVDLLSTSSEQVNFIGRLSPSLLQRLSFPAYISGTYYEGQSNPVNIRFAGRKIEAVVLTVTNDVERNQGMDMGIELADFAIEFQELTGTPIMDAPRSRVLIVGRGFADALGLEPGSTVAINPIGPDDRTFTYRIAGLAGDADNMQVYAPINEEELLFLPVPALEVSLEDGKWMEEYRSYAREYLEGGVTMVANTASLENLRNALRLTEMLYPMAVVAALFIGGFLCCLVILQSTMEAAVLRVLGTTKGKTRLLLTAEQAILSAAGLAAWIVGMHAYKGFVAGALSGPMRLFAVLYLIMILVCGAVCSALATHRPPLELLQVKE